MCLVTEQVHFLQFEEVAPTMRQYNKKLQTKTLLQVMIEEYRSLQLNLDLLNHQV